MADETLRGILVNLGDKDDNKRKKAEKDMFDHLRGFLTPEAGSSQAANINEKVTLLIANIVQDFCRSAWPSQRTSGLVALSILTFALEKERAQQHAELLTDPVLVCFSDEDALVRYKACEAFYNIAKVIRAGILRNISGVFDGLCRLYTDVEQNIKEGAQSLDRLIRDIVMEQRHFDFAELIPLITCRIHILNPNVRQLVLGWIVLLDSLPQVDMISFLPHFLEGLFSILASENRNFRMEAQACLESIWGHIQRSAVDRPERTQQAIAEAASTVARCCRAGNEQRSEDAMRMQALKWLVDSVKLQVDLESGVTFFLAGPSGKASQELPAWLPQKRAAPRDLPEGASAGSQGGLQQLIPELLPGALYCLDDGEAEIRRNAAEANAMLLQETLKLESDLPVEQMASAVICAMSDVGGQERSREVLLKCLGWADTLLDKCPARVVEPEVRGKFFEAAEKALLREEEEVASTALRFMAQLASTAETLRKGDDLVGHMCERLFDLMKKQQSLLTRRGELIIRLMCKRVDAKRFFATAAKTLETIEDPPFARNLVQVLNRGLLTGPETQKFRAQLRAESSGQVASASFPMILMKSWLCCPVSSLALSFWMNWYELAAQLATRLATMQRTEEIEEQLKHFVELLESPVFSDVRLQLLTRRRPALLRAVLRLAALLPQERALQRRLQVVETGLLLDRVTALRKPLMRQSCTAEAEELLASFDRVTVEHRWKDCIL